MSKTVGNIILGIDPGTNLMGYGIVAVEGKKPKMMALGVIMLSKIDNRYERLQRIYQRVRSLVEHYKPDHVAIEAPFFGKNIQSMLKLGRAQGVAIAASLAVEGICPTITEYEPRKIKMAITGNGDASKEQVREMLRRTLGLNQDDFVKELDASDALAAAVCHYYEISNPIKTASSNNTTHKRTASRSSWKEFIAQNPDMVKK